MSHEHAVEPAISRSLAPLREVVASLTRAAEGASPTGEARRRLERRVREAGDAALPALVRALLSPMQSEADLAAWLLARLGGPKVASRVARLLEDPRTPEEMRDRVALLLVDLSARASLRDDSAAAPANAPSTARAPAAHAAPSAAPSAREPAPNAGRSQSASMRLQLDPADLAQAAQHPLGAQVETLVANSVREFLHSLESTDEIRFAVELVTRDVPAHEVVSFVSEVARHGGALALPLLDGLLAQGRAEGAARDTLESLREEICAAEPSACERRSLPRAEVRPPRDHTATDERTAGSPARSRLTRPVRAHRRSAAGTRNTLGRRRAFDLLARGKPEAARPLLERAVSDTPGDREALSHLGVCLLQLGQPEAAIERLARAIELDPDEPLHHWNLAAAAKAAGQMCRSYLSLRRYLELGDDFGGARNRRREAYRFVRGYESLFRSMYPHVPFDVLVDAEQLFERALADLEAGRFAESIDGFHRVIERVPDHHPSWGNLGAAELAVGNLDEAGRCLRRAIELKPDYEIARDNLRLLELRH